MVNRSRRPGTRPIPAIATGLLAIVGIAQLLLSVRVVLRLVRSANRPAAMAVPDTSPPPASVTILVPVLNEADRLGPCLAGLRAQGPEVGAILVIDGGSTDDTVTLVRHEADRDPRIRAIDASPVPADWNGKAWNLQRGFTSDTTGTPWVLTIDADVRPRPGLVRTLLARAEADELTVLSGATRQRLSGAAEGLVHPALLTTLVYRYGIPGTTTTDPDEVQANGQCMLIRRDALDAIDGFSVGRHSLCEDVTVARHLAIAGHRVGFAETGDLVDVAMYGSAREAWTNWPRSLTMRDQFSGHAVPVRLAEVALVQGVPLLLTGLAAFLRSRHRYPSPVRSGRDYANPGRDRAVELVVGLNRILVLLRVGVLVGMARAYDRPPLTYWLSPLLDAPVSLRLIQSALRRTHVWRGRPITRD